jgi:hypothetical protein
LQQFAWRSAATDLRLQGCIESGAGASFGGLVPQLFHFPRAIRRQRRNRDQYPQRSHRAERHQQDCDPRPFRKQVRRRCRQNQKNEYKEHVQCPDERMDETLSCKISV